MKNKVIRKMGIYILVGALVTAPITSALVPPMTVYAVTDISEGQTVEENTDYINENNGTVTTNNNNVDTNNGTVGTNNSYVWDNQGTVVTNNGGENVRGGVGVEYNNGTVTTNSSSGIVGINNPSGTITTNYGTVKSNEGGNIVTNNGTVKTNTLVYDEDYSQVAGVITTNNETVEKNVCGTITTNNGTVNENVGETEQKGTITTNSSTGVVANNYNCGVVSTNDGTIKANYGEVVTNNGTIEENKKDPMKGTGEVTTNNGTIETNNGSVATNSNDGTISINTNVGCVDYNYGTIDANNGTTYNNYENGTIKTNTGTVAVNSGTIKTNTGTVTVNSGTIKTNTGAVGYSDGTVEDNYGTVSSNSGTILRQWYKLIVSNFNDFKFGSDASQTTVSSLQVGGKDTETESDDTYDYYILDGKSAYVYAADSVTKVIIPDASDATIASLLESGNLVYDETKDAWKISGVNSSTGSLALNAQNIATLPSNVAEAGVTVSSQKSLVTNGVVDTTAGNEGKITSNGSEVPYFTSGTKVKIDGPTFDPSSATISGGPTIEFLSLEGVPMELSSGTGYVAEAFHKKKDNTFTYDVALVMPNATTGYAWACEYNSDDDVYVFSQVIIPVAPSIPVVPVTPVDNNINAEPVSYTIPSENVVVADNSQISIVKTPIATITNPSNLQNLVTTVELPAATILNINDPSHINTAAPTIVTSVSIQVDNTNSNSKANAQTATAAVNVITANGNINVSPQLVSGLKDAVTNQVGNDNVNVDIKVNTTSADGRPVSIVVNTNNLKNNTTLKAFVLDPVTGGYVITSIPNVKYNDKTGLTLNSLAGGSTYTFVSAKEAKAIEQTIMNSVKVSPEYANPVAVQAGSEVDMSQALSSSLNMANVSDISYAVSGNKAVIDPVTGKLTINGNATKGTITVSIKVTLANGKTKTVKAKIKIG